MIKKNIEKNNKTSKEKNQNIGLTIKLCKKITIFALLETTIMIAAIGCGSVKEGTATSTDADAEVTDTDTTEKNTEVVSWIAEAEKEKVLARQEAYEVANADETDAESLTVGTYDTSTGKTEITEQEDNSSDSSTTASSTGSSTGNTSAASSGTDSSSSSTATSTGTNSNSSSGSTSSNGTSSSSSSKSTSCSHNWTLTSTKAEEGYYTYHCTSSTYSSGHYATRYICNACGAVFTSREAVIAHSKETIAYAEANYSTIEEQALHSCGGYTKNYNYKIDNTAWMTGTATKSWVSTSAGTYTYTCSKCGETKTESFTENHSSSSISFTIDPYNGEDVDSWLNSHYN